MPNHTHKKLPAWHKHIAQTLLNLGAKLRARPVQTESPAQRFVDENANAWLFGVIFDQQVLAENAWEAPYLLKRRLGHFNMRRIAHMPIADLRRAVAGGRNAKALHRYVKKVPVWLKEAATKIATEYRGNAANIWSDCHTAVEVIQRLDEFKGISQKKAHMAAAMIHVWQGLKRFDAINLAVDVHVRRVWRRAGLVKRGQTTELLAAAAELYPRYPGALDYPTWEVGRTWCQASKPNCAGEEIGRPCPLARWCQTANRFRRSL